MTPLELWAAIVPTGILSAVFSAGSTVGLTWLYEARVTRRREATYLAIRIATALEAYALACYDYVQIAEAEVNVYKKAPETNPPQVPAYPKDANWKALKPTLANEALSFLNEIAIGRQDARYASIFESNGFQTLDEVPKVGKRALEIAVHFRDEYGILCDPLFEKRAARMFAFYRQRQRAVMPLED